MSYNNQSNQANNSNYQAALTNALAKLTGETTAPPPVYSLGNWNSIPPEQKQGFPPQYPGQGVNWPTNDFNQRLEQCERQAFKILARATRNHVKGSSRTARFKVTICQTEHSTEETTRMVFYTTHHPFEESNIYSVWCREEGAIFTFTILVEPHCIKNIIKESKERNKKMPRKPKKAKVEFPSDDSEEEYSCDDEEDSSFEVDLTK